MKSIFEDIVGKGLSTIIVYKHFLLFSQCFPLLYRQKNIICHLQLLHIWVSLDFNSTGTCKKQSYVLNALCENGRKSFSYNFTFPSLKNLLHYFSPAYTTLVLDQSKIM